MKNTTKQFLGLVLALVMLITSGSAIFATETAEGIDFQINNPYETVDWENYGQFKANFHSHSVESDGGNQPAEMIEDHYAKGFDILANTDHSFTSTTFDRTDSENEYLTPERAKEIAEGTDRDGRGMLNIPFSNEQSIGDHLNTFWADFNNEGDVTLEDRVAMCHEIGGISHINHPGRYTGGKSMDNDGELGAMLSSLPETVKKYTDLYAKYDSLVGMEIINKKDGDSFSDRILWDNILTVMMPERSVWGFSNDDSHSIDVVGFSWNMMLLPENTEEEVRNSMENGTFYAIARVAKRELGLDFLGEVDVPVISNIAVDEENDTITIAGENYDKIEWIADGEVIAEGETIELRNYADKINGYVRAQLIGPGGIAFTQPFGIEGSEEREAVLTNVVLVADNDTLNATKGESLALNVRGIDSNFEYTDLDDAKVEFQLSEDAPVELVFDNVIVPNPNLEETAVINVSAKVDYNGESIQTNSLEIALNVPLQLPEGALVFEITDPMDDVEENLGDGSMYMTSSDLEIAWDGDTEQLIGMRWNDVKVPAGAKVSEAYILFTVDEIKDSKNVDPFNVIIVGEKIGNSPAFEETNNNVSSREQTEAKAEWKDIAKWAREGDAGKDQLTPDISAIVQEIIDQEDWAAGNSLSIFMSGEGVRCAEAFEGDSEATAKLVIVLED